MVRLFFKAEDFTSTVKENRATLVAQTAVDACKFFSLYGDFIQAASIKTCAIYIGFRDRTIGSLRISDHHSKYAYKWNINVKNNFKDKVTYQIGRTQYHANTKNKTKFFEFMEETFSK